MSVQDEDSQVPSSVEAYRSPADEDQNVAVGLVENTMDDIKKSFSQILLVKLWWRDIGRRVGSNYHHATLFNGSLLLPLAILAYILAFEFNPPEGVEAKYRHYICASMAVALLAQFFFTFNGICFENPAMLLAANVVAGAIALRIMVRPLLDQDNETGRKVERWIIEAIIGLLVVVHFVTSFLAWHANDGFRRFIFFAIGGTSRIQSRYRVYQSWVACSRIDLLFTILTCMSIGFFCQILWWHYFFLALVVVVNAIWRSMLLRLIRTETCISECFHTTHIVSGEADDLISSNNNSPAGRQQQQHSSPAGSEPRNSELLFGTAESRLEAQGIRPKPAYPTPSWWSFILVALLNMNSPLLLGFALFSHKFIQTDIPEYSYFLVFLSFALFIAARVLLTIATVFTWRNFGKGMNDVFAKERGVAEFLLGSKSLYSVKVKRSQPNAGGSGNNNNKNNKKKKNDDDDDGDSDIFQDDEDPFAAAAKSAREGKGYGTH